MHVIPARLCLYALNKEYRMGRKSVRVKKVPFNNNPRIIMTVSVRVNAFDLLIINGQFFFHRGIAFDLNEDQKNCSIEMSPQFSAIIWN